MGNLTGTLFNDFLQPRNRNGIAKQIIYLNLKDTGILCVHHIFTNTSIEEVRNAYDRGCPFR